MTTAALTPYLTVVDAHAALDFYTGVFGAEETGPRLTSPDGGILHTELRLGDTAFMLAEHQPDYGTQDPHGLGGTPVRLALHVENADATVGRAVERGAEVIIPVDDQFYGHRAGRIQDPFGHVWIVSHQLEELSAKEMQRRFDDAFN